MEARTPDVLRLGPCEVHLHTLTVRWDEREDETLTPLEAALLRYLAAADGRVVGHEEALQQVWGYREGVRSRAVSLLVGRLRKKIEVEPKSPEYLLTAYGVGFRLVLPESDDATALVGRASAVEAIRRWQGGPQRLMAIVGPGGVGKTHLVTQVFGGRGVLVALEGCAVLGDVEGQLLHALGEEEVQPQAPARGAQVLACLRQASMELLILDGVESCLDVLTQRLPQWMAQRPELKVVVTSRAPWSAAMGECLSLGPLEPEAAAELLRGRLDALGFASAEVALYEERILEVLEGLPLAIELAAQRAGTMGLERLAARLDEPLDVLEDGEGLDGRHGGLRSVIAASWSALGHEQQALLSLLAHFHGGIADDAARSVWRGLGRGTWSADRMRQLGEMGWLQRVSERPRRWRMPGIVRGFVASQGGSSAGEGRRAHREFFVALGEQLMARADGPGAGAMVDALQRERSNLDVARRGASPSDHTRLGTMLAWLCLRTGVELPHEEDWTLVEQVDDPLLVLQARVAAARLAGRRGALDLASTSLHAARAVWARDAGRQRRHRAGLLAEGELWLATSEVQSLQSHYGGAVRSAEQALSLFRAAASASGQGRACERVANALRQRGGHTVAIQYYRDALRDLERAGNRRVRARVYGHLGSAHYELGELDEAAAAYQQAETLFEGLGSPVDHARCQLNAAMLSVTLRRLDSATSLLEESLAVHRRLGDLAGETLACQGMARICIERGQVEQAEPWLSRAHHLAGQAGLAREAAVARRLQGWLHHMARRYRKALLAYSQAADVFRSLHATGDLGMTMLWWSLVHHAREERELSLQREQEAVALLASVGSPLGPMAQGLEPAGEQEMLATSFQARRTWDLLQLAEQDGDGSDDGAHQRRHGRSGFLRSVLPLRHTLS